MNSVALTEIQEDAMAELLNIGMGLASASLGEMVGEEVRLSVPSVEFLPVDELSDRIQFQAGETLISCIQQPFTGAFWGDALLFFPERKSLDLVKALTGETVLVEDLSELEQDVVTEVGNVILNACLGSLANVLDEEIRSELPVYMSGTSEEIIVTLADDGHVMLVRLDFSLPEMDLQGYVVFMLDIASMQRLRSNIDRYIGGFQG